LRGLDWKGKGGRSDMEGWVQKSELVLGFEEKEKKGEIKKTKEEPGENETIRVGLVRKQN